MAASKKTAARGNVRLATAKKDERRCGVLRAHRERRYRPNAATAPEEAQVIMPGMIPADARAYTTVITLRTQILHVWTQDVPEGR